MESYRDYSRTNCSQPDSDSRGHSGQSHRWTDRQTDGRTDRQTTIQTVDGVTAAVCVLLDKSCTLYDLPTAQLKAVFDIIAPFLTALFNRSLSSGSVPEAFKAAYITLLLQKSDIDPADVSSYRPVSNLSVVSKLLEWLVARQLLDYLSRSGLLPRLQSAYRAGHSTETAV